MGRFGTSAASAFRSLKMESFRDSTAPQWMSRSRSYLHRNCEGNKHTSLMHNAWPTSEVGFTIWSRRSYCIHRTKMLACTALIPAKARYQQSASSTLNTRKTHQMRMQLLKEQFARGRIFTSTNIGFIIPTAALDSCVRSDIAIHPENQASTLASPWILPNESAPRRSAKG